MPVFDKAKIILPKNCDMEKWSVVACDQYTSEPQYWEDVENFVGSCPSTYNLVFPEIYLNDGNADERIENINKKMVEYMENGNVYQTEPCLIYVERTLANGSVRKGIVGVVDLEEYDFNIGSQSKIRATEGTVLERIPPRVKIRRGAELEFPHVMLLIDDDKKEIIEKIDKAYLEPVYNFSLMKNSGRIKGYKITDTENIIEKLEKLGEKSAFEKKYSVSGKGVLQYAVGDGNHSLATAKTCYENEKEKIGDKAKNLPIRYALVEIVNLHDESLVFEPIHRVVFDVDEDNFLNELKKKYQLEEAQKGDFTFVSNGKKKSYVIKNPDFNLTVGCIQSVIDEYIKNFGGSADYIHGASVAEKLAEKKGNVGILLNAMQKSDLFKTVILDGALPRKTFSMGEACDKRFYLEGRKIR
ncbi:MAG: DUF1015 domain-containing protein [Oscillospiraceae bacterium]|nr:DUF1015 domain-containing protein [Oscillospiraceae bacterium]